MNSHLHSTSPSIGSCNTASTASFNTTSSFVTDSLFLSDELEQYDATTCKPLANDDKTSSSLYLLPDSLYDVDEELGYPARKIVNYWKKKEVAFQKSRTINLVPTEQMKRRYAVDWIRNLGNDLNLRPITIQSAVSIFDDAMWSCGFTLRDWRLLAACSLNMAAKCQETELSMPMVSEIAEVSGMVLTTHSVTQGELRLAEALNWNLLRITPMHFLDYYMHGGVLFNGDLCRGLTMEQGKISQYTKKYVRFFANLSQQDLLFLKYMPSVLAAAVIMATRHVLCISPLWREELVNLTSYTEGDIIECGKGLWGCYVRMFPDHCALRLNETTPRDAATTTVTPLTL